MTRPEMKGFAWKAVFPLLILAGCAQIRGLEGGERDTSAPRLLWSDPPDMSVFFTQNRIAFTFDEFIQAGSLSDELVVSPPLASVPEVQIKRKTLYFTLRDSLLPGTTYVLNFGNAVTDYTEGNRAEVRYVFSTGSFIDSLEMNGVIADAHTGLPEPGVRVMLYPEADSAGVLNGIPRYVTRTGADGTFALSFLADGRYHLAALKEETENYRPDPGEKIAFFDGVLDPSDSTSREIRLSMAGNEEIPDRPREFVTDSIGRVDILWPHYAAPLQVSVIGGVADAIVMRPAQGDTTTVWLRGALADGTASVAVRSDTLRSDTLMVPVFEEYRTRAMKGRWMSDDLIAPGDSLLLRWPAPVAEAESRFCRVYSGDSLDVPLHPETVSRTSG
jgi:hypothetical protein